MNAEGKKGKKEQIGFLDLLDPDEKVHTSRRRLASLSYCQRTPSMGKKKSKAAAKRARDGRGYATTATSNAAGSVMIDPSGGGAPTATTASVGGSSSRGSVEVSARSHEGLTALLEDLKLGRASVVAPGSGTDAIDAAVSNPIDPKDRRFLKKVEAIHDTLTNLHFTDGHIESALCAEGLLHGSNLVLDTVLDWLCLHLPSEELPPLFVEVEVKATAMLEGGISVHAVPSHEDAVGREVDNAPHSQEKEQNVDDRDPANDLMGIMDVARPSKDKRLGDDFGGLGPSTADEKAKRALLLAQYQYEEDSDEEDSGVKSEVTDDLNVDCSDISGEEEVVVVERMPEEIRLEELEVQIREEKDSLNDDAANYMRSKYEIIDLKKKLKILEGQARGMRAKIAKIKATRKKEEEQKTESNMETGEGDVGSGILSLFGNAEDGAERKGKIIENDLEKKDSPMFRYLGRKHMTVHSFSPSIPKDWTGKTPKVLLEENCRKRKLKLPKFSKLASTCNGCKMIINKGKGSMDIDRVDATGAYVLEHPGPFYSFKDSQEYLATEALYDLNPTLQLYRLLPSTFSDNWKAWLEEKRLEVDSAVAEEDEHKKAKMESLAKLIFSAWKETKVPARQVDNERLAMSDTLEKEMDSVVDDWENQSTSSASFVEEDHVPMRISAPLPAAVERRVPSRLGKTLQKDFQHKMQTSKYENMLKERSALPIFAHRESFLRAVRENAVTILCASTGAGKSTNAPLFLLEDALLTGYGDKFNIICTQPRRISAISVAERVADEMCERIGGIVGYHIRLESKKSKKTRLQFCTTGVVLRRLQDDPELKGVTHIILDEVHERSWQIDFLLIALRQLINSRRKDLKVVLMSATIDAKVFCSFFPGAPFLEVPGRTFPVAEYFLEDLLDATDHIIEEGSRYAIRGYRSNSETAQLWVTGRGGERHRKVVSLDDDTQPSAVSDEFSGYKMSTRRSMDRVDEQTINYDLIEDLLSLLLINFQDNNSLLLPEGADQNSLRKGAVLIFLPGMGEIRSLSERLKGSRRFGDRNQFEIIAMHSTLSPSDQRRAFVKPKSGQKIILSTNICETSITIPDVVLVIDSGLVREVRQDTKSGTPMLVTDLCSRASAKQRSGRAGRVQSGMCCKLFSSRTSKKLMHEQPMPELQRVPLEEVCLSILSGKLGNNCMEFLLQAPQPPSQESVENALTLLQEVGAIEPLNEPANGDSRVFTSKNIEQLTPLGHHLAKLPVHVRLGKMLIFGALFKCVDNTLTVAASLSTKSPFSSNIFNSQLAAAAHRGFAHESSDFLTICNVWKAYKAASSENYSYGRKFCDRNYLNHAALMEISDMRDQFFGLLRQIGFLPRAEMEDASSYNVHNDTSGVVDAVILAGLYPNVARVERHLVVRDAPALWHKKERIHFHSSSVNHNVLHLRSEWIAFFEKFATSRVYISATSFVKPFGLMLFGKSIIVRHLERKVVVDDWIELKIAAQTGVAFRELRHEIEGILKEMIENAGAKNTNADRMIGGIVELLSIEQ